MNNFMASFNVVFPIFFLMAVGYFLRHIRFIDESVVKKNNSLVFKLFLPMMLFKNVYNSKISDILNYKLILFASISALVIIGVLFVIVPIFEKDNRKRGVIIQGMFRSNFVIFGVPVSEALCGTAVSGSAAVLIAFTIPIFNVFSVIALEVFDSHKSKRSGIVKNILTNPLIIASGLGLLVLLSGIRFPTVIEESIATTSSITTPLALIMLGASINFKKFGPNIIPLVSTVLVKLIIIPMIFLGIAVFGLGFKGADLAILLAFFATPPAVSSYTMAQQMGADDELAGLLVMFGTTVCVLTMFMWIYIIKSMGLI